MRNQFLTIEATSILKDCFIANGFDLVGILVFVQHLQLRVTKWRHVEAQAMKELTQKTVTAHIQSSILINVVNGYHACLARLAPREQHVPARDVAVVSESPGP